MIQRILMVGGAALQEDLDDVEASATRHSPVVQNADVDIIARDAMESSSSTTTAADFGSFTFKNLDVLEKKNEDVIRKLKCDQQLEVDQATYSFVCEQTTSLYTSASASPTSTSK